jgi:hypothetical protein
MNNTHQPPGPPAPADDADASGDGGGRGSGGGGGGTTAPAAGTRPGRHLITLLLLAAAALDLTRCGLILATARHPGPAAALITAGLAAAALSLATARGCQHRRHWPPWTALLTGAASAPQAAATGFHPPSPPPTPPPPPSGCCSP